MLYAPPHDTFFSFLFLCVLYTSLSHTYSPVLRLGLTHPHNVNVCPTRPPSQAHIIPHSVLHRRCYVQQPAPKMHARTFATHFLPFPLLRCCICTAGHVHPCTTRRLRRPPLAPTLFLRLSIIASPSPRLVLTSHQAHCLRPRFGVLKGRTSTFPLAHIYPSPLSIRGTLLPRTDRLPSIQHRVASLLPIRTAHSP